MNLIRYNSRIIQYQSRGSEINTYSPLSDPNIRLAYCAFPFPGYTGNTLRIWKPSTNQEMDINNIYDASFRSWLGNDTPFIRRIYNQTGNTTFDARNTISNLRLPILNLVNGDIEFDGRDGFFDVLYLTSGNFSSGANLLNTSLFHCCLILNLKFTNGFSIVSSSTGSTGWSLQANSTPRWSFNTGSNSILTSSFLFNQNYIVTVERTINESRIYLNNNLQQSISTPYTPTSDSDTGTAFGTSAAVSFSLKALTLSTDSIYLTQNQQFLSNRFQEKRVLT